MKYRFITTKSKDKPWKLVKDPDGEKETIGTYETIQAAKSKLRSIVRRGR